MDIYIYIHTFLVFFIPSNTFPYMLPYVLMASLRLDKLILQNHVAMLLKVSHSLVDRPTKYCTANPSHIMPSPLSCAQYFDCSSKITVLKNFKKECTYPQLYDSTAKQCMPYNLVDCGNRFEPTDPCE